MDYKEKYTREDALRDLQGFIGQLTEGCQKAIKTLIPELSESEDERIRKVLIDYFTTPRDLVNGFSNNVIRAWLEKQKEQEQEPEEDDFTVYHPLKCNGEYECFAYSFRGSLTAFSDKKDLLEFLRTCFYTEQECEEWIKSQKCQKPTPRWMIDFLDEIRTCSVVGKEKYEDYDGRREFEAHCLAIIRWLEGHYIEQKPAEVNDEWIEDYWEHEKVNNPYSYDKGDEIQFDHNSFVRFCKRYCQKPAEWSEEDKKMMNRIIEVLDNLGFEEFCKSSRDHDVPEDRLYYKEIAFLKSLRPHWKPNAQQLAALEMVIEERDEEDPIVKYLKTLLEDLKKL